MLAALPLLASTLVADRLPATYNALIARSAGSSFSSVATVVQRPLPSVGEGEVLVRVTYAGVNGGCETFRARGEHAFAGNKEATDFALGAEGVGVVAAIGDGVSNVAVGDAVCFVGSAFAEFSKVKADGLWVVPHAGPEMVGLRISALTACAMLEQTGRLQAGETVLVTAAAGGAGHFAVQFAKLAGCTVIGTTSSPAKAAALCKLGCDYIINHRTQVSSSPRVADGRSNFHSHARAPYTGQDVAEKLAKFAPGGLDAALEGVGGAMLQTALDALAPKGRLLQVGYISEYPHNPDAGAESAKHEGVDTASLFWKAETVQRGEQTIYGNAWPKDFGAVAGCKDRVLALHAEGKLVSLVDGAREFHGVSEVAEAVDYMLSGAAIGKVVVKIGEE